MENIKSQYANRVGVIINETTGETVISFVREEPMIDINDAGGELSPELKREEVSKIIMNLESAKAFAEALNDTIKSVE